LKAGVYCTCRKTKPVDPLGCQNDSRRTDMRKEEAVADRLMAITDYLQALANEKKINKRDAEVLIERSEDCLKMMGWTE